MNECHTGVIDTDIRMLRGGLHPGNGAATVAVSDYIQINY